MKTKEIRELIEQINTDCFYNSDGVEYDPEGKTADCLERFLKLEEFVDGCLSVKEQEWQRTPYPLEYEDKEKWQRAFVKHTRVINWIIKQAQQLKKERR